MRKLDTQKTEKKLLAREIGRFLWEGFCDPDGVGVSMRDVLDGAALVGVNLTDEQKESVIRHMNDFDAEVYTSEEEEVRDQIAAATDNATYEQLFSWLEFVVGDIMSEIMVREWRGEFTEEY